MPKPLLDASGRPVSSPATQPPPPGPEINWDKAAPQGPPTPVERPIPPELRPVVDYMKGVIANESLLLELCVEHMTGAVQFVHNAGMVGIDYFPEVSGAQAPTRLHFMGAAIPLAIEIHEHVLESLNGPRRGELAAVIAKAMGIPEPMEPALPRRPWIVRVLRWAWTCGQEPV